jgi:ribosome-associated protein
MNIDRLKERGFDKEFVFKASRSAGPGGQNVNKVNSKVELRFDIQKSVALNDIEKQRILSKNSLYLTQSCELVFTAQTNRSQVKNKEEVTEKFFSYLVKVLTVPKKRKPTKPGKNAIEKRLTKKRNLSEIKQRRIKPKL